MSCTPCQPPQASLLFFPGTPGPTGPQGVAGPVGPAGEQGDNGPVGVYLGSYTDNVAYYDTAARRDIVFYNGKYWIADNAAKSGQGGWLAPTVADWEDFGNSLVSVATKIDLLFPADIAVALTLVLPGLIQSDNYAAGVSGFLLTAAGRLEALDALIAGQISTNTPKFNLASVNRTMPAIASATYNIPAILDAAIPVNPLINNVTDNALIFFGWLRGANSFLSNRFGNSTQVFDIFVTGVGTNTSAGNDLFYIQLYYRTRLSGGSWSAWVLIGHDAYMQKLAGIDQSFQLIATLTIVLLGLQDIQFSAGFSKGVGGTASLGGATISVKAYN